MAEEIEIMQELEKTDRATSKVCPFPGLRSYLYNETHLYYGQDLVTQRVLNQLIDHRFVAIMGGAGVGKTSFLNCGLKPYFNTGIVGSTKTNWHIIHTRPSNSPIRNLAKAINKTEYKDCYDETAIIQTQISYNVLKRGKSGLIELLKQYKPGKTDRYLIVIDQFEDVFRFKNLQNESGLADEAFEYVSILMHAIQQKEIPIYLTVVVRSDFADDCLMFPYFSNIINRSNVLVPRMGRELVKDILAGPIAASRLKIDNVLLLQILNDASNIEDLLPRIQHAMRRTWESWNSLNNPEKPISLTEYEISGGLKNSINYHANELFDTLSDDEKKLCEKIFKSLAERGSESKGFTRPSTISEICGIARSDFDQVVKIIEIFRKPSAGFLSPSDGDLTQSTVIDLTHSSLLRTWSRVKTWVQDETISSQMYRQLSESSAQYQVGKMGLLRPPDLQFALNWQEKQKPTLEWAKRYNPAFERTMVYLRTSNETFIAEETFKKLQAKKAMHKVRSLSIVLGSTALLALFLTIYSQVLRRQDVKKLRIANEQQIHFEQKSTLAEKESQEYLLEKRQAEIAALEANKLKEEAVFETRVLSEQKTMAEHTASEAVEKTSQVQQNLQQITIQKQQAEKTALQEAQQRTEAEKEKDEVFKKRMQNLAQTLAVKSIQATGNRTLKGLLALNSYMMNVKYGNSSVNPDVYNALYGALEENGGIARYGLKGHLGAVKSLCIHPRTNALYSTGGDGKVLRWVLTDDLRPPQEILKTGHGNLSLSISGNGRYLAVGSDIGVINVLDLLNPNSAPIQLKNHQGLVYSMVFTPNGQQLFSSGADKRIILWDIDSKTGNVIYQEANSVKSIAISPDGKFLAGGADDGRLFLWDIKASQMIVMPNDNNTSIFSVAFSPSGLTLASGDAKGYLKIWNPNSRKLIRSLHPHSSRVVDVKFSPSGEMIASSSWDGTVAIFDAKFTTNVPILLKEVLNSYVLSIIFTNDNKKIVLATSKPDFVYVWPAQTRMMAEQLCSKVNRALTQEEWNVFIGSDIKYEKPCD